MCLAIPGKIVSIAGEDFARGARVNFGGILTEVSLAYVPEAEVGDYVIVHAGFAISVLDEAEAVRTCECWKEIGELEEIGQLAGD
jgi:hydrogenase expression/formation protein HypC